jgi:hypothetical protein
MTEREERSNIYYPHYARCSSRTAPPTKRTEGERAVPTPPFTSYTLNSDVRIVCTYLKMTVKAITDRLV